MKWNEKTITRKITKNDIIIAYGTASSGSYCWSAKPIKMQAVDSDPTDISLLVPRKKYEKAAN
jgi:hypothetical protein